MPERLVSVLTAFILVDDFDLATQRIEGLQVLLEEWDECHSMSDFDLWKDMYGRRSLILERDERGNLHRGGSLDPSAPVVPESVVAALARSVLPEGPTDRVRRIEGFRELLADWEPYFTDEEKLLGHLVRVHGLDKSALFVAPHDHLLKWHAKAHSLSNPAAP